MANATRTLGVLLVLAGVMRLSARGDDEPKPPAPEEEAYIVRPTPEHEVLKREEGVWDATVKSFIPGAPEPLVSQGVERNTLMTGGLWLVSRFESDLGGGGQTFEGHGVTGYDPSKSKYVGTWVDSMSTHMMNLEGTYDPKSRTMTYHSEMYAPGTKTLVKTRGVTEWKGDDARVYTLFVKGADSGEEFKLVEITYKRRAK